MREFECKSIVFSSSATVYGDPKSVPIKRGFFPLEGLQTHMGEVSYLLRRFRDFIPLSE